MAWHMSDLKFVQSNSLALLVQRELLGMILSGEISKGGWLSETALAQRFGVSRGPIREAFRSLEESGLLRQEKNRGVFVREISVQEADEIYEIREQLDGLVGRRVAENATDAQVSRLETTLTAMTEARRSDDIPKYYIENLSFHDQMAEYCGNTKLALMYRRLMNELHLFRLHTLSREGAPRRSEREHLEILKAIKGRDPDSAASACRAHARASRKRMREALGSNN